MTASRWLIAISIAANVTLGAIWFRHDPPSSPVATSEATAAIPGAPGIQNFVTEAAHRASANASPDGAYSADNFDEALRRLQQAGIPRRMIVRIMVQLHAREVAALQQAILADAAEPAFWKPPSAIDRDRSREILKQQRQLDAALTRLLGEGYLAETPTALAMLQAKDGPLPPEKLHRVELLRQDYLELRLELQSGVLGGSADREKLRLLEQEQRADLEALLTPQELFEYDLRHSSIARGLRNEYAAAQLTEAEFRSLFRLYQDHERQDSGNGRTSGQARNDPEDPLLQQVRSLVDPARAAELMQARDREARRENQLVVRLGLPLSVAADVVKIKRDISERASRIQGDATLTAEQRRAQFAGLTNEADQRLNAKLGSRGLSAYREYGGTWLEQLQQQVTRGAPVP